MWQERRFDLLAAVSHGHFHVGIDARQSDLDTPVFWSELGRVRNEVPDNLLQSARVTTHRALDRLQDARDAYPLASAAG